MTSQDSPNDGEAEVGSRHEPEDALRRSRLQYPVVGIGASAGSIPALTAMFEQMPSRSGMAFVVIVHLSPDHDSVIDRGLSRVTGMPVVQVTETTTIAPDHVYVISPALDLAMDGGEIRVTAAARVRGRSASIDFFFRTLAEVHRERSVAIVLTGKGSDGAVGVKHIKECGGVTIAQSPEEAEYADMPTHAIATGDVDFILPLADMAGKLVSLWENAQRIELPVPSDSPLRVERPASADAAIRAEEALHDVMAMLRARTGHDFSHYKRATVLRRVARRLQVNSLRTLPEYARHLHDHGEETALLLKDLLISVTNFFRDRDSFRVLESELEVVFASRRKKLRAWIAGCATGEEAYSIAMMLIEYAKRHPPTVGVQVFASDIDESAIETARDGLYPESALGDIPGARRQQFFRREHGQWRVRKDLRETILFSVHNVLRDPPFSHLDLVCCRNLLIYLDRSVQLEVLEIFHFALEPGGLLFLGSSETADAAGDLFTPVDKRHKIYRANPVHRARRPVPSVPYEGRSRLLEPFDVMPSTPPSLPDLHERFREAYAPPSVLIDEHGNILHSTPRAGPFLRFAPGQPSQDLLDVVRPELRLDLRTAVYQARQSKQSVDARRVAIEHNGDVEWVAMTARPVADAAGNFMLVLFDAVQATLGADAPGDATDDPRLLLLEQELQSVRAQLQGSIGQSATSHEELRASNEELQAINEELRSTTEELETSTEELQSVNEELVTVNQELKTKVEESSKVNDDLINLMASTSIAIVFVDRRLRIKRFTPPASKLFNLIDSDLGRSLLDITHRLDYPQLEQDVMEAFESLRVVEREVTGNSREHYLVRALPYRTQADMIDGAVINFIDITATRRAEQMLRAGERQLRMVLESTKDYAIITCDLAGVVTSWNKGAERIFGYAEYEMIGQPLAVLFTASDRELRAPEDELRRAREDGRATDERWHLRKDGSNFYCSGIVTPMFDNGLVGYAKIARDMSEAKRTEAQLEALLGKETETRAELQAASTLKDDFLAVMSHELKHPLNLINVNAELLARLPEVRRLPAVARATEVIRRTVMNQAKIIDDLLDLSRMQTGKLALEVVPIDWGAIVSRVVEAVADDIRTLGLQIDIAIDPAASRVTADSVRVEQIVWNLMSNALKFTPPGGRVRVELNTDGLDARLDVIDSGRGITPEFMPHVFDLFRQADRGTTRSQGGMGIGLALVKNLAEAHGGRVAVASEGTARGSRFSVWLPLADGPPLSATTAGRGKDVLSSMRILLVDDTLDALDSFATLLGLVGATVTTASSAKQALAAVEEGAFDLIVSDVAMPEMDGYELMRRLRAMPATARLPSVALTGFGRPQDEQRAMAAGFDAHLTKPVRLETLIEAIHRLGV